jgi:hypothetical protein
MSFQYNISRSIAYNKLEQVGVMSMCYYLLPVDVFGRDRQFPRGVAQNITQRSSKASLDDGQSENLQKQAWLWAQQTQS